MPKLELRSTRESLLHDPTRWVPIIIGLAVSYLPQLNFSSTFDVEIIITPSRITSGLKKCYGNHSLCEGLLKTANVQFKKVGNLT